MVLLLAAAGCAASSNALPASRPAPSGTSTVTFTLKIPKNALALAHRMYVSAGTQGIGISYGASPATFPNDTTPSAAFDVSSGSGLCTTSGSTRTCTLALPALIGTDDFQITAWNQVPVSGSFSGASALSAATLKNRTVSKGVANTESLTLDGIVNSVALAVSPTSLPAQASGSAAETATVTAVAKDAAGDAIVGGYYDASGNAVSFSVAQSAAQSGDTVRTTLSGASLSSSTSTQTVSYSGGGTWGTTLTATPSESIAGTNTAATLNVIPTVVNYATFSSGTCQPGIVAGPDGNLWFTDDNDDAIDKTTTSGTITKYKLNESYSLPWGIASGPDGNLWFTDADNNSVGKITTSGTITQYSVPTSGGDPRGIVAGPDGNLWFTEYDGNKIAKITTSGTISEYPIPTASVAPWDIASGPDGNLWFTEDDGGAVGKITTSGTITQYTAASAYGIASAGGDLWTSGSDGVEKITTSGGHTLYSVTNDPFSIADGPNGFLWDISLSGAYVSAITQTGTVLWTSASVGGGFPSIALGPDGNLWYGACAIGKVIY